MGVARPWVSQHAVRPAAQLAAVRLSTKEVMTVKRNQLIGGIGLLVLAAWISLFLETTESIPIAITLTVVGIALVATSGRS